MEQARIILDDGTGSAFDQRVRGDDVLPDGGDLTVVTKNNGTKEGRPIVLFTFTVQLPDGTLRKVQTVTTVRMFQTIAKAIEVKYGRVE